MYVRSRTEGSKPDLYASALTLRVSKIARRALTPEEPNCREGQFSDSDFSAFK